MTPTDRSRSMLFVTILAVVAGLACVAVLPLSCSDTTEGPVSEDVARTLATFNRVDDYPLYVMRYYGDYGFDAYLRDGSVRASLPLPADAPTWGCTTFAALGEGGGYLLGRNFDWYNHMALLLYTEPPEGYASVSVVDLSYLDFVPGDGSNANMTRLLRAPFWPFDGMNEMGVAVGMMAVPHAEGGDNPAKTTIGSLDVIRLILDHAKDAAEAVSLLSGYNVDFGGGPPVHYLVSDATRASVVIEFIDNEMAVIPCEGEWQVATNFIITGYEWSGSPSGCWRYNTAYNALQAGGGVLSGEEAMTLLQRVSQSITMWSVVYGGDAGTVSVAVGRNYGAVYDFTMDELRVLR